MLYPVQVSVYSSIPLQLTTKLHLLKKIFENEGDWSCASVGLAELVERVTFIGGGIGSVGYDCVA